MIGGVLGIGVVILMWLVGEGVILVVFVCYVFDDVFWCEFV